MIECLWKKIRVEWFVYGGAYRFCFYVHYYLSFAAFFVIKGVFRFSRLGPASIRRGVVEIYILEGDLAPDKWRSFIQVQFTGQMEPSTSSSHK
jgi:hypothetical protein